MRKHRSAVVFIRLKPSPSGLCDDS